MSTTAHVSRNPIMNRIHCGTKFISVLGVVLLGMVVLSGSAEARDASTRSRSESIQTPPVSYRSAGAPAADNAAPFFSPAFNSERPGTLVEDIPADIRQQERPKREHGSLAVFGFRMQGASSYNGELPFWIHSNRFGELHPGSTNVTLHLFGAWRRDFRSGISLATGAGLLLRDADDRASQFQEAYVQVGYGPFVLWAGRKREYFGMVHPGLTMGSTDISQNARPIPKITLTTEGFRAVPGTRGILDYDASLSHGWLRDDEHRFVERPFLHQKHLYLRLFNDRSRVVPHGGIKHFALWGGESPLDGSVPDGPRAFLDVFFSLSPDSREILGGGQLENKYQNHMGTYDFSLLFRFEQVRFSISRQFLLEDTPNARFGTPWDGMWGAWVEFHGHGREARGTAGRRDGRISQGNQGWRDGRAKPGAASRSHERTTLRSFFRPFAIRAINYEHINTLEGVDRYPHRDRSSYFNYYNHSRYRGGWTYGGRSIGNPLFFGEPGYNGVVNNLMLAHHVGAMGQAGVADWRLFATYSRNYGATQVTDSDGNRYAGVTGRRDQWSFMLELGGPDLLAGLIDLVAPGISFVLDDLELTTTFALDFGQAQRKNAGVMVGLRWATR